MRVSQITQRLLGPVLDFCYPGVCANCEATVGGASQLCAECAAKLDALIASPTCEKCAMPLGSHKAPCPYCVGGGIPHFEKVIRLGVFEDPLKHLIHQMKYHRRWPMGEYLAQRLAETERAKGLLTETQAIVPVPLHIARHVRRGYNQADVIARRIAAFARIPVVHALRRTRNTETQTHLHSHDKRLANVRDAFALRRISARRLRDRHIVVVDDVMTSGATLGAVGRVLKQARPASLCALVLAIADPKRRGFEVI